MKSCGYHLWLSFLILKLDTLEHDSMKMTTNAPSYSWLFLKVIYLKGTEKGRKRLILWVTAQKPATGGGGPSRRQEHGTRVKSLTWLTGTQLLSPSLALPKAHLSRKLESGPSQAFRTGALMGYECPKCLNHCAICLHLYSFSAVPQANEVLNSYISRATVSLGVSASLEFFWSRNISSNMLSPPIELLVSDYQSSWNVTGGATRTIVNMALLRKWVINHKHHEGLVLSSVIQFDFYSVS